MTDLTLQQALLRVTWVFVSALLALGLARRASASFRHLICVLCVAASITLPLAMVWSPPVEVAPWAGAVLGARLPASEAGDTLPEPPLELIPSLILAFDAATTLIPDAGPAEPARVVTPESSSFDWQTVISVIWLVGTLGFLLQSLTGFVLVRARFGRNAGTPLPTALRNRCSVPRHVAVRLIDRARQPGAVGIWHPHVVLPPAFLEWDPDRQGAVLAHEIAHVTRRDGLSLLLWHAARAVWWPHPLLWWCGRILAASRERACDDIALNSGFSPSSYARHLVEVARSIHSLSKPPRSSLAMITQPDLEHRVQALLARRVSRRAPGALVRVLAVLMTVAITVGLGAIQSAVAQTTEAPEQEAPAVSKRTEILVAFDGKTIRCNDEAIEASALVERLRALGAGGAAKVTVVAPHSLPLKKLQPILDAGTKAGFPAVLGPEILPHFYRIVLAPVRTTAELAPPPPVLQDPNAILIAVTKAGKVVFAGREIGVSGVAPLVKRRCETGDHPVIVQSASDVNAGLLIRVVDEARRGGASQVAITTPSRGGKLPARVTTPVDAARSLRRVDGDASNRAVTIKALDTEPRVIYRPAPRVPAALRAHAPATVVLLCVVNPSGNVASVKVQSSTDPRFESAAMEAVAKWRFEPGRRKGQPASFKLRVPVTFATESPPSPTEGKPLDLASFERKLEPSPPGPPDTEDFAVKDLDEDPRPITQVAPGVTAELRRHTPAKVWLLFVVDETGRVTAPKVDKSTDSRFDRVALEAIKKWRFAPGRRNGKPVRFRMKIPISFPRQ